MYNIKNAHKKDMETRFYVESGRQFCE